MKCAFMSFVLLLTIQFAVRSQSMDDKMKILSSEIAELTAKSGCKKLAVTALDYKGCNTEFGKYLAEELTGNLSLSSRSLLVVNQKLLEALLVQNNLTQKGLLEAKNDASKLGNVSGIEVLVYGTITTIGEETRISVSLVKLPTLAVIGFAKSTFPLTNGIKEMLTCLDKMDQPIDQKGVTNLSKKISCSGYNTAGVSFTLQGCSLNGRSLICKVSVLNNREDRSDAMFLVSGKRTNIVTDSGRQYSASQVIVGNAVGDGNWSVNYNAIYGIKVNGTVNVNVEDSSIKNLQLFEIQDQGLHCLNVPVVSLNHSGVK